MELNKHAKCFLDERAMIFFVHRLLIIQHNKSFGNEKYFQTTTFFKKTHGINVIKFNSFQRKPLNMLNYAYMPRQPRMFVIQNLSIRHYDM